MVGESTNELKLSSKIKKMAEEGKKIQESVIFVFPPTMHTNLCQYPLIIEYIVNAFTHA